MCTFIIQNSCTFRCLYTFAIHSTSDTYKGLTRVGSSEGLELGLGSKDSASYSSSPCLFLPLCKYRALIGW